MERVTGIEPASSPWKGDIIAVIRHPHLYSAYYVGGESCNNTRYTIPANFKCPGRESNPHDLTVTRF